MRLSLLVVALLVASTGLAKTAGWISEAERQLTSWQADLSSWKKDPPSLAQLEERQNQAFELRQKTDACVDERSQKVESLLEKLNALGDESATEAAEVKERRKTLTAEKQTTEAEIAVCRLISLGIRELQENHKAIRGQLLSQALGHRGEPVWAAVYALAKQPEIFASDYHPTFDPWPSLLGGLVAFLILYPLAGAVSRLLLKSQADLRSAAETAETPVFSVMLAKRLPWIAGLVSIALVLYLGGGKPFSALLFAIALAVLAAPAIQLLVCNRVPDCSAGLPARLVMGATLLGTVVYLAGLESLMSEPGLRALQGLYFAALMAFSIWLVFTLSRLEAFQAVSFVRIPLSAALLAGPGAMWLGYQSLAELLLPGVYGSLAAMLVAWAALRAGNYLFSLFEPDGSQSSIRVRSFLGYKDQERVPGLWIGRSVLVFSIISGLLYCLLIAWHIPDSEINAINAYFVDGFDVGAVPIVPSKILSALLAFFILLTLAKWLRNKLSEHWLSKTRLDAGARESIVSLTTYTIVGLALLLALSISGVDFQNIAIVAGALSVGIGFGLQNIVNNFVSGLILLFERPVKPGDWIVVGSTEGYVKRISIRYTLIQTFDRADVLVPNSELISSQVTNWMLKDSIGRVIAPVGVAYGSDVDLVRDTLLRVATSHPMVLNHDWRVPAPRVLFMGFGDSSLNFEVRCFIKEVDYKLSVRSELLFAINEAFQQAGIEIPFPQRVVHLSDTNR